MLLAALRTVALLAVLSAHVSFSRQQLPSLSIQRCDAGLPATLDGLSQSNGSSQFPARTTVSLCWTPDNLVLEYFCQDDLILRNDFLQCNEPMYTQVTGH